MLSLLYTSKTRERLENKPLTYRKALIYVYQNRFVEARRSYRNSGFLDDFPLILIQRLRLGVYYNFSTAAEHEPLAHSHAVSTRPSRALIGQYRHKQRFSTNGAAVHAGSHAAAAARRIKAAFRNLFTGQKAEEALPRPSLARQA